MRQVKVAAEVVGVGQPVDLLAGLNPEQREVVLHDTGPLLVGAVAGAGKTRVLVNRIARLVRECGVPGYRILSVTFSKKGADEMNDRLDKLVPGSGARVGTAHSVAHQWMQDEVVGFRKEMVDDRGRYELCVKDAVSSRTLRNARGQEICRAMGWKEADPTYLKSYIGLCKARGYLAGSKYAADFAEQLYRKQPVKCRDQRLTAEAYVLAERLRKDRQLVTFDDMLMEMCTALNADDAMRRRWASKWDYVLQDEAQDENPMQREILAMLAEGHRNYMVVGDPGQTLYGFRGAEATGLLEFVERWDAKVVLMHRNYRCGRSIATAANGHLANMAEGTRLRGAEGQFLSITPEREQDGAVEVVQYEDTDAEGEGVADTMMALRADGVKWSDMAALYRVNSYSRGLEECLLSRSIPYVVVGGTNFYKRKEVAALLAYLRVAAGRADFDEVRRSLNAPFRFLGEAFTSRVKEAAEGLSPRDGQPDWTSLVREVAASCGVQRRQMASVEEWADLVEDLARTICAGHQAGPPSLTSASQDDSARAAARPAVLLERLLREAQTPDGEDYVRWVTRDEGSESPENNRLSNIRELVRASERFATVDLLLDYVELQLVPPKKDGQDRVTLMSIHRSKGLEFPTVFLLGAVERVLPHSKAEDMDEERRLAYVAFTRAKDRLVVTCARKLALAHKVVELEPSRFIAEAGLSVCAVVAPEKKTEGGTDAAAAA